jgi:hypothetical protein
VHPILEQYNNTLHFTGAYWFLIIITINPSQLRPTNTLSHLMEDY